MDIDAYLKRINCVGLKEVSLANLKQLHANHLLNIPFENYSIALDEHVNMDLEWIYNKLVNRHRGGFCFELNQAFAWLLRTLGYEITLVASHAFVQSTQAYLPWFSHVAILTRLDGRVYLTDVGMSSSFREPLEFTIGSIQKDKAGYYCIKNDVLDEGSNLMANKYTVYKTLNEPKDNVWREIYQFDSTPREMNDFKDMLEFVQSAKCARLYNRSFCIRHTESSLKMLVVYRFSNVLLKDGVQIGSEEYEIGKEEFLDVLKNEFNIVIDRQGFQPRNIELE